MARKKWMTWGLAGLAGVVLLGGGLVGAAVASSRARLAKHYDVETYELADVSDPVQLAEGKRLYVSRGCSDCHGVSGEGRTVIDDAPGRLSGINLTEYAKSATTRDYVRALRHGVTREGRALLLMPSHEYQGISDEERGKIIAFIERLPEVKHALPEDEVRPLGNVLHVLDAFPLVAAEKIDHEARITTWPKREATVEFGASLAVGCTGCHGAERGGGPIPGAPPEMGNPANLTPHETGLRDWSEAEFVRAFREGKSRDGHTLDPKQMPWPALGAMNDVELSALYKYLRTIPAKPYGGR